MPTANRHKNSRRMEGGALKRPKKQKIKITTNIGFKLVPKSEPNGGHNVQMKRRNKCVLGKKIDVKYFT